MSMVPVVNVTSCQTCDIEYPDWANVSSTKAKERLFKVINIIERIFLTRKKD